MSVNPLLVMLNEAKALGEDPEEGLLRIMGMMLGNVGTIKTVYASVLWEKTYGEPTWESLREYAKMIAINPLYYRLMERLAQRHSQLMEEAAPQDRERLKQYLE